MAQGWLYGRPATTESLLVAFVGNWEENDNGDEYCDPKFVLLGGAYVISKRREKMAAEDQKQAVAQAVEATKEEADAALQTALAKATKDKEATVAREVKKAKEEAAKEMEAKLSAAADAGKESGPSDKGEDA